MSSSSKRHPRLLFICLLLPLTGALAQGNPPPTAVPARVKTVLKSGTRLTLPAGYQRAPTQTKVFRSPYFVLRLQARRFAQGEAVYLEVLPPHKKKLSSKMSLRISLAGRRFALSRMKWGYRGLVGIHTRLKPGNRRLKVQLTRPGLRKKFSFKVAIARTKFPVYRSSMDLGKYSNKNYLKRKPKLIRFIRNCTKKKRKAFRLYSPDFLDAALSHPRDAHKITSRFNAKRIKQKYIMKRGRKVYKKPRINYHSGVDLKGQKGAPIFALARGRVAIAEKMYYEGNFILLDHGRGILTAYMHQSKLLVRPGQMVNAGQQIGESGSTGMVTGPHLHLSLYIRGVKVDGLSLLSVDIRD